ncbi:TetR/AcrR family transcriptional regulator [Halorientalis regularis]|jgi:AcrR family transcriptional regulator|uniref:DNA-binding transcriptional regulator, AcrR family n=1 Tax=Halorientalis regularis TaxID=660518 RepID=A0A1G7Q015_9EURY|nr:TetR/AcrR family transcriptional regulator [Halorientalis regularis]SDF91844.1 DNA-binding transcriptional regulator, AcrR family [Halorientalis regularis]
MPKRTDLFESDPDDTREAIMKATYDALSKHGYADLTIQRIGDEFDKSKSLLYHHYDSKDALLVDFLGFMLERMEGTIPLEEAAAADDRLRVGFDHVFAEILDGDREQFNRAMTELRAQSAHDDSFREQFTRNDRYFESRVQDIIEEGIQQGIFREVDAEQVASMLVTIIQGATFQATTSTEPDLDAVRTELDAYIESRLLDDD